MKHLTITNMTGARNRGCEALVQSIIEGIREVCGDRADIYLDSADSQYDAHEFGDQLKRVFSTSRLPAPSLSPAMQSATFAAIGAFSKRGKSKRWKALANLRASDLLIATGGDVFTSDYGGLRKHARTLHAGRPVALLGQTIGPFTADAEAHFRASLKNVVLCTVRESETLAYLQERFPELDAKLTADVAFRLKPTSPEQSRFLVEQICGFDLTGRRLIGVSVSSGILGFRAGLSPETYLTELAEFIDTLNGRGFSAVLIPHVQERAPGNNDIYACFEVLKRCRSPRDNLLLALTTLSASDYKGIIGLCDGLIGARTHATIASMSQGVPTVSIAYSRKAWGIMRDYFGKELGTALTIDVAELTAGRMTEALELALGNGNTGATAALMRERALQNFTPIPGLLSL